jgi:GGDEF domain-containing protein
VLFVQGIVDPRSVDWFAIGVAAVVLFVLVLMRMSGFVRRVQQQADQLNTLAMHDELTGLPNRRRFEERLRAALAGRPQVALVDLNDFKAVNDRLGHTVGDQVLLEVGAAAGRGAAPVDTVARLGGDEFAILLPDTSDRRRRRDRRPGCGGAAAAGARRRARAADGGQRRRGRRAGLRPRRGHAPRGRRDVRGEGDGRRQLRYDPSWTSGPARRHGSVPSCASGWTRASSARLPADRGAARGRIVAVEALARWEHPTPGGDAGDFIPVAERNG